MFIEFYKLVISGVHTSQHDEDTFKISGKSKHCWTNINPHITEARKCTRLNSVVYLQEVFKGLPTSISYKFLETTFHALDNFYVKEEVYCQQDEVPAHYHRDVRGFLVNTSPER